MLVTPLPGALSHEYNICNRAAVMTVQCDTCHGLTQVSTYRDDYLSALCCMEPRCINRLTHRKIMCKLSKSALYLYAIKCFDPKRNAQPLSELLRTNLVNRL